MMIPGITIEMGGRQWTVPPLTLGQLRRLMPKIARLAEIGSAIGESEIDMLVDIVAAALARNYPEITAEKLEDLLDLGNAGVVLNAVLSGSGLTPAGGSSQPGEASAPGEGPGAAATPAIGSRSAGPSSTASSPPSAATATPSSTR